MNLDITASFSDVINPTPFGVYDADPVFQSDANGMIQYVYSKLGGRTLGIEMFNKDVYACLEEAMLEYSAMVNSYQAKSSLADLIGSPTGTLAGHENQVPQFNLNLQNLEADAYSAEALAGGTRKLFSGSIPISVGTQVYDLQAMLSASGILSGGQKIRLEEVFYFNPSSAYRFFDTTSAINYLHNQFHFESFTPETVFYLLPVWEDVLRAQQMQMSQKVRRSNYSYHCVNNVLRLYPVPQFAFTLFFTYYLRGDNPWDESNDQTNGVANLSNVPFGNIQYSKINSISRQWVHRFAFSSAKEVLGQVRNKVATVPIPNGDLTLNGPALISEARDEMQNLREDLKNLLEATTYSNLATQESAAADALKRQLNAVPLGIFVG